MERHRREDPQVRGRPPFKLLTRRAPESSGALSLGKQADGVLEFGLIARR
jgi:hypothetical protein